MADDGKDLHEEDPCMAELEKDYLQEIASRPGPDPTILTMEQY